QVGNDAAGIAQLLEWLGSHGVVRVGLEATGGYERKLRIALEAAGIAVVVHQPVEIKLYGRLSRHHAKTDAGDARLIAAATAAIRRPTKPADPDRTELGERLTAYEHVTDELMSLRTFRGSMSLPDLIETIDRQIAQLGALKEALARQVIEAIKASERLRGRYD